MEKKFESPLGNLLVSDDQQKLDIPFIHQVLSHSYWAENIPQATVEQSIRHSISFGVYLNEKQVGFARVISDQATFAYLADVFIVERYRGNGFSKRLMETIHAHPDLQGLRRWMLGTRDAHSLYRQFAWTDITHPELFMQKHDPNVYKPKPS
jgi:N-acetylglutamate synthase-like GNAT family acetyltransferase